MITQNDLSAAAEKIFVAREAFTAARWARAAEIARERNWNGPGAVRVAFDSMLLEEDGDEAMTDAAVAVRAAVAAHQDLELAWRRQFEGQASSVMYDACLALAKAGLRAGRPCIPPHTAQSRADCVVEVPIG